MSAVAKQSRGPIVSPPTKKPRDDSQIRRDRRTAALVVALMIALMALIIWLASLGGGINENGIYYWPMMP